MEGWCLAGLSSCRVKVRLTQCHQIVPGKLNNVLEESKARLGEVE